MHIKSGEITWIVLRAIENNLFGKGKLSLFLKGSRSQELSRIQHKYGFGGLFWFTVSQIENIIEQLERMELIKKQYITGSIFSYPQYVLTDT